MLPSNQINVPVNASNRLMPHYFKKKLMVTPEYVSKMSQEEIINDFRDQINSVNQANLHQKSGEEYIQYMN